MSDSCVSQGKRQMKCYVSGEVVDGSNLKKGCTGIYTTRGGQVIFCKPCYLYTRCGADSVNGVDSNSAKERCPFVIQFAADHEEISSEILDGRIAMKVRREEKEAALVNAELKQFVWLSAIREHRVSFQERLAEHEHRRSNADNNSRFVQILHAVAESFFL